MSSTTVSLDERQLATVLAALRFWQASGAPEVPEFTEAVSADEVDDLCEHINTHQKITVVAVVEGDGTVIGAHANAEGIEVLAFYPDTFGVPKDDQSMLVTGQPFISGIIDPIKVEALDGLERSRYLLRKEAGDTSLELPLEDTVFHTEEDASAG